MKGQLLISCLCILVLLSDIAVASFQANNSTESQPSGNVLVCSKCGRRLISVSEQSLVRITSAQAARVKTTQVFGEEIPLQTFVNPAGYQFDLVLVRGTQADRHPQIYWDATWFEGYSWSFLTCSTCHAHLGWYYQPDVRLQLSAGSVLPFEGLIYDRVLPLHVNQPAVNGQDR